MSQQTACKLCELLSGRKLAAMQVSAKLHDPHLAYQANLEFSLRLWPSIALLEIAMRNRFATVLEETYGDRFFLEGSDLIEDGLNQRLLLAAGKAAAKNSADLRNSVVSSLSFGFWAMMLNRRSEPRLWVPALRHAFRGDKIEARQHYFQRLRKVALIRNRIAHHENILDFEEEKELENIRWLLEALEPGSSQFAKLDHDIPLHPVE